MLGLVSNDSIKAMVSYAEMYKAAKSPEHTMETLADLEKKVEVYAPTLVFSSSSSSLSSFLIDFLVAHANAIPFSFLAGCEMPNVSLSSQPLR